MKETTEKRAASVREKNQSQTKQPDNRVKLKSKTEQIQPTPNKKKQRRKKQGGANGPRLRIIPLGGLGEIGKNMNVLEYGNDMIIVDCGVAFPEEHMPGIDAVIQDFSYVIENKDKLRAIFLTHGHEDHIGAIPYLFKSLKCPVYGGRLTIELLRRKLAEKKMLKGTELKECQANDVIKPCASFQVDFIRVNHSIADAFALAIKTPLGYIIHTGDFKIDYTPINGEPMDLQKLAEYGSRKVLLLMAESTNVEIPGVSPSEMHVGESFQRIFKDAPGRVIVATFSSHVHRMQQIFTAAEMHNRKVALIGRSMLNVFSAANSLNYINMKPDTLIDIKDINNYDHDELVILTTGSQAEPLSALSRIAFSSHRIVEISDDDTVILSAHPIPGNEKPIYRVINELFRRGAHVIYESLADVHVSGHAYKNELKLIHQLVKPKYFIPVHGEYRMLYRHAELAKALGQKWEDIFILNNGDILELNAHSARVNGYVSAAPVLIDGSGMGDLDNIVLRDRKLLADDGVVSVSLIASKKTGLLLSAPIIKSVGFLYESEAQQVLNECAEKLVTLVEKYERQDRLLGSVVNSGQMRDYLKSFFFERTKRRPVIIISLSEINR